MTLSLSGLLGWLAPGFALFATGLVGLPFLSALQFALLAVFTISGRW